jgi:putative endonuclease
MSFFVYIIKCSDNYLYTGITCNIDKRLFEHRSGKALNTKNRLPLELAYKEEFFTRKEAAKREREIKGWRREKKEKLIREFTLRSLSDEARV